MKINCFVLTFFFFILSFMISNIYTQNILLKLVIEPEMIKIPAGYFSMGSDKKEIEQIIENPTKWECEWFKDEKPQRNVYLDEFYISKYEVTNEEYKKFLNENPEYSKPAYLNVSEFKDPDQPVVGVSWDDAAAYCNWLSEKTKKRYRLPTEAEWEKAARGTDSRIYPWGNSEADNNKANFMNQSKNPKSVKENIQGASPYGLMNMAGNEWEWCSDWYGENYYNTKENRNPAGPSSGTRKIVRGGSYKEKAFYLRCAERSSYPPETKNEFIGFRIVRESKSQR